MSRTGKSIETECKLVVARGWRRCGQVTVKGYKVSSWSDENVLELMFVTVIHNFMDMLKNIELHTLGGWIVWYVKYISINLFLTKEYNNCNSLVMICFPESKFLRTGVGQLTVTLQEGPAWVKKYLSNELPLEKGFSTLALPILETGSSLSRGTCLHPAGCCAASLVPTYLMPGALQAWQPQMSPDTVHCPLGAKHSSWEPRI